MAEDIESRCRKAILEISDCVKDIDSKLTHFLENYREDYYRAKNGIHKEY